MIKLERTQVMGMEPAIRGMRNPMNSWDKSDSGYGCLSRRYCGKTETGPRLCKDCAATYESHAVCSGERVFVIGPNDHDLAMRLIKGGPVEAKFRRQIFVSVDITAPLYWWKEFDTYKVGTVANSCSTMHKIHAKEFVLEDFSCEHLLGTIDMVRDGETLMTGGLFNDAHPGYNPMAIMYLLIGMLNDCRKKFLETNDKKWWWQMIQLLPTSYNQMRTITFNYEVLAGMYKSRKNHKLQEWRDLCEWALTLPYPEFITGKVREE